MMEIMSRSLATWRHIEVIRGTYRRSRRSSRAGFSIFAGKTLKKEKYNFNRGPEELENKWGFSFSCVSRMAEVIGGGIRAATEYQKANCLLFECESSMLCQSLTFWQIWPSESVSTFQLSPLQMVTRVYPHTLPSQSLWFNYSYHSVTAWLTLKCH